jgi:hypothetical protein
MAVFVDGQLRTPWFRRCRPGSSAAQGSTAPGMSLWHGLALLPTTARHFFVETASLFIHEIHMGKEGSKGSLDILHTI